MGIEDDAVEVRARVRVRRTLASLHALIEIALERSRQDAADLSVIEFTDAGRTLLASARPVYDHTLASALALAEEEPELAPLVDALHRLPDP